MIVILCNSFQEAISAFKTFVDFLENTEPWDVKEIDDYTNSVLCDDDLRYIFIDYRFLHAFNSMKPDVIDSDLFLEDLYAYWK